MHVFPLYHLLTITDFQKAAVIKLGPNYRLCGVEEDGRFNMVKYNNINNKLPLSVHIWPNDRIEYYDVFGRSTDAEGNRI